MSFDFSKTESAKENKYLQPGVHKVKITKGEFGTSEKKNTPFVAFTFENEEGLSVTEKFMITENALPRLQYLHEACTKKKLDKAFKSAKEVGDYFVKTFTSAKAPKTFNLVVGGDVSGKTVYSNVPYTGFILSDDEAEFGLFEEGDENWKKYVKKSNRTTEASGKKQGVINDDSDDSGSDSGSSDDDGDDTPW